MKTQRRGKLMKSRAVESPADSSSDEKSEDERRNLGSRLNLLRDKRKRSRKKSEGSENPPSQGIAQSLKRTFGFFRRSEKSSEDVEAAVVESVDTPESGGKKTMDVVVDVHTEHEEHRTRVVESNEELKKSSPEHESTELDLIEEIPDAKIEDEERPKSGFLNTETEESDLHDDVELTSEVPPTSGGRRKRWDKLEISAGDIVEDLTKPKRRQWATGAASAEIRKASGKKIVMPKRSLTAEPRKSVPPPKPSRLPKPIAAPRTKTVKKEEVVQGFDNDAFSSEHDEVLRIETVNNHSPKIKISSVRDEKIEDGASTLSEEEEPVPSERKRSIEEVKEYVQATAESTEVSDVKEFSASETPDSREFVQKKNLSRRRSSDKRKSSSDKRSEDEEEEDEELETVLDAMDKKSRKSSGSSKIEIIPSKFFEMEESSDETTISTNEEMHSSRREVPRPKSRSRSKSKSSRQEKSDEKDSERSSRTKRKTTSSSARNSPEELAASRRRPKSRTKKRRKKKDKHKLEEVEEETKYLSLRIHRSDMLEADYVTRHPMVKVHIVYADNGDYLKVKSKDNDGLSALQPIISGKFDFKEKRSMVPVWEEELVFEIDFKELLFEGKGSVVVLFEIVDLLSFNEASLQYDQLGQDSCWYKVAWAFLRPVGANGTEHVNKIVRLQLYRPKKTFRRASKTKCEVYKWWKSGSRDKYPSSLYVSLSPIDPPKLEPIFSEQLLQLHDLEARSDSQNLLSAKSEEAPEPPKWTRHAAQSCQIPNETYLETEASDNGCFYVAFSNDGKYLACALSEEYDYPILVYKIAEMKIHVRFAGHKNFIYSLSWSHDDRFLLSVSSDQTARFWDVKEQIIEHVQSLPHPSYVYCGKFSPDASNFILTGCYDHVARIWARLQSRTYELVQELEGHESFVNSVCIQPRDETILTGDGIGVVIVWTAKKSRRSPLKREWQIIRKIKIKEVDGVPINTILVHPLGSRLLVHSRNGGLRLLDMFSGVVIKKFESLKNHRIQVTACISPCGGLIFCGGEDSTLNVWSIDSGKLVATYEVEGHEKAVSCVDYHPYDHVLAFSVYGAPIPAKVLKYDREADGIKVGLKMLAMTTSMMSVSSSARFAKDQPTIMRNGGRNFELSARSLMNSSTIPSFTHLPSEYKDDDEARRNLRGKLQRFMESGPNLKAKSLNRLNGIIEKIDRILMYATSQKSQDLDVESARNSVFTVEEKHPRSRLEMFEMQELPVEDQTKKGKKKHRQRSRSARNALSPTPNDFEFSKAFSDSAAFTKKVSKFSDDSSNSNRSVVRGNFIVERLDLKDIDYNDTESGFKDSLDTIVDGKEDFPSEEVLEDVEDVESLKSDDTYIIKKSPDGSDRSNATFIIESEVPVPKPRKRTGRIEVM